MLAVQIAGGSLIVIARSCVCTVDAGTPLDDIEIEFENPSLAEDEFGNGDESELGAFAENGAACSEEQIFDELLGEGGGTACACAFKIIFCGDLDLVPVEAVMLVKAGIFSGDDGVLEFR